MSLHSKFEIKVLGRKVPVDKTEGVTGGFDPTAFAKYKLLRLGVKIHLERFWGVTGRYYFRDREILFTSDMVHPLLHKWITLRLDRFVEKYDPEMNKIGDGWLEDAGYDKYYGGK